MTEKQIEKWTAKAKSGLLYHNSTIRELVSAMREAVYTRVDAVESEYNSMSAIGITSSNVKGHLTLNEDKLKAALAAAGQAGVDGIHARIGAGIPPPNAPVTLSGGWIRNPVSGKPVKVKGKSGTTPLVDTGQLYDDFGWEITER